MSAVSATPPSLPESVQQWHCEMSETFGGLCPESSVDAAPVGTVSGVSLGGRRRFRHLRFTADTAAERTRSKATR